MRVAVYATDGNKRAMHIASAMHCGIQRCGLQSQILTRFEGVEADVAVAYGWTHASVFRSYRAAGSHYLYWDLGYWNRRPRDAPIEGHHRLAVDDWDTACTMARRCPANRLDALGIKVTERRQSPGEMILVAGMSAKAAGTHGYQVGQWETRMIRSLEHVLPGWPVIYRPKPCKAHPPTEDIETALTRARLLVTHHSNVAVEAIALDVPVFAVKGPGKFVTDLISVDHLGDSRPYEERRQLLADVAYAQWTPQEMRSGEAWQHARRLFV